MAGRVWAISARRESSLRGQGVEPMGGLGGEPKILPVKKEEGTGPGSAPLPSPPRDRGHLLLCSHPRPLPAQFLACSLVSVCQGGWLSSLSSAWHVVPVSTARGRQCSQTHARLWAGPSQGSRDLMFSEGFTWPCCWKSFPLPPSPIVKPLPCPSTFSASPPDICYLI